MSIADAIRDYGLSKLALACKVSPQAVFKWAEKGVPAERVLDIERATEGKITRHELRPDLYPIDEPRKRSAVA